MTELTPTRSTRGQMISFALATIVALVLLVESLVEHTPVRLSTAAVIASLVCSFAVPVGPPQLRKPLRALSIVLILVALYALLKR